MGWWAALLVAAMAGGAGVTGGDDESIDVVVRGTLRTGIMAVGGETTGTTVTARGATLELDLRMHPEWRARAESLHGRRVVVTGRLEVRAGVERRQRFIVTVDTLDAAATSGG